MFNSVRAAGLAAAALGAVTLATPAHAQLPSNNGALVQAFAAAAPLPLRSALMNTVAPAFGPELPLQQRMQGRPLAEQVGAYGRIETQDAEQDCLANAVYFEARGEPLEGQLAVAEVVLNRAASGRYPTTLCGVVTQPWQFSFVRRGVIPAANRSSEAWRRAVAIARIAQDRTASQLGNSGVLWYHANYVSPSWGRRLNRTAVIGAHIFYR